MLKDPNSNLEDIYNQRYSGGYRQNLSGYEVARWAALEHFIPQVAGVRDVENVLDYGSGRGLHIPLWEGIFQGSQLFFCDISSVALNLLAVTHPKYKSNCGLIQNNSAPFENDLFDVIVSIEVMEHVNDFEVYLNDIFRLLKPNGIFIWTTPCANMLSIEHIYNILTRQIEKTKDGYRRWSWEDPTHLRRFKSSEIREELIKIGFEKPVFRFRAHFFSFIASNLMRGPLRKLGEKFMLLDYTLFRLLPNGASMVGYVKKITNR